ncbi:MAG: 4Fe-4S binding protein [Dehalococcoidia bacterium]|nr:4Fe-4S binding protein [Dehalococcoidia bacterium]MDP6783312.1 4Fe-4S binding protein [Dehalococcoidia bacterium]
MAIPQAPLSKDHRFHIDPDKCTGCLLCSLACSFIKTSAFGLSHSLVHIQRDLVRGSHERFRISFDDGCDGCGLCARYCNFDAIRGPQHGGSG